MMELARLAAGRTVFVVRLARVLALHGERLECSREAAARWVVLEVEEGEAAKTVATAERLWEEMLAAGGKRDSRVIAFGGGSVGDLAGFAAGCFLRGLEFVQIPTTLLAQVDASIGGKTGVDLPGGKNTVGLFHHPAHGRSATPRSCRRLPREELRSGLVEVIKMAALLDPELLRAGGGELDVLLDGRSGGARTGGRRAPPRPRSAWSSAIRTSRGTAGSSTSATRWAMPSNRRAATRGCAMARRWATASSSPCASPSPPRPGPGRSRSACGPSSRRLDLPPLPPLDPPRLIAPMARDKKARECGLVWVLPALWARGSWPSGYPGEEVSAELDGLRDPFARHPLRDRRYHRTGL